MDLQLTIFSDCILLNYYNQENKKGEKAKRGKLKKKKRKKVRKTVYFAKLTTNESLS